MKLVELDQSMIKNVVEENYKQINLRNQSLYYLASRLDGDYLQ